MNDRFDVVVIGAGFAGLRAARDLTESGVRVALLEARDRVGGRTWTQNFPGSEETVELGGSYFTPDHHRVVAELHRYGLSWRSVPIPADVRWRTGGKLRRGLPVGPEQWSELERVMVALANDAQEAAGTEGCARSGLSLAEWCRELNTPDEVADFLRGWWSVTGGASPEDGAMIDLLGSIAAHGGLLGLMLMLARCPVPGWSALADAMAAEIETVRLEHPVARLRETSTGVQIDLDDGQPLHAEHVILAVPANLLGRLSIEPGLPAPVARAAGNNRGASAKLWLRARNVPSQALAAGRGVGLDFLLVDRSMGGDALMVGFGPRSDFPERLEHGDVVEALRVFHPQAELVEWTWHDWTNDPWSRGTWLASPPGMPALFDAQNFVTEGRLRFASADFAPEASGWIEGAMASGAAAAVQVRGAVAT
jgi:monoamine oxidase